MKLRLIYAIAFLFASFYSAAYSQEIDCLKCHAKLTKEKVVHAAVGMGCPTCHAAIDAKTVPHKKTNSIVRGLSTGEPELCYGCHDKSMFTKKNVHAAVGMGCTGCHNPHSSKNEKLLTTGLPDICFSCHDKAGFSKKTVHAPVAGGMCLSCHSPHSSDEMALLINKPLNVCLECHPDVMKKPHAVAGFSSNRHPLGEAKKTKQGDTELKDPLRPNKPFYCGSCHNPHSSVGPRLFRFDARTAMDMCTYCHKM